MIEHEVYPNLYVGDDETYKTKYSNDTKVYVIHACKDPYHRNLLGYTGRGAPKDSPEYLFAHRTMTMYCNLIDSPKPEFISREVVLEVLKTITKCLNGGYKVYLHCNKGESRAPGLAFMWLTVERHLHGEFEEALLAFKYLYPEFNPSGGIKTWCEENYYRFNNDRPKVVECKLNADRS